MQRMAWHSQAGFFSGATFAQNLSHKICLKMSQRFRKRCQVGQVGSCVATMAAGSSCPHSQDVHTAHIQSAIRSAADFFSGKYRAFMFWRALQGLAIAHSCCGAVLWHSITYVSTSIVIDILLLVIRTTCLRRFSGEFLQSVYAGKPYSSYT